MNSLELQPTAENIKDTFVENKLARNDMVFGFIEMLSSLDRNFSFALDGKWGSGKTFFVKHIIMVMDALVNNEQSEYRKYYDEVNSKISPELKEDNAKNFAIYFDAWANDNDDDPLLSLIYTICEKYSEELPKDCSITDILFDLASAITSSPIMLVLSCGLLGARTPEKLKKLYKDIGGKDPLADIKQAKSLESKINNFFDALVEGKSDARIVVFIDELDRCKPSYAIKLLERIKHYMTHKNITFVFSTNMSELSCTVKKYYGFDFNGERYLEKMFSDNQTLPPLTVEQHSELVELNQSSLPESVVSFFCNEYECSLREYLKIMSKVRNYISKHGEGHHGPLGRMFFRQFLQFFVIPFLICLRIQDNKSYIDCINGRDKNVFITFFKHSNISGSIHPFFFGNNAINEPKYVTYLETFYAHMFTTSIAKKNPYITIGIMEIQNMTREKIISYVNT